MGKKKTTSTTKPIYGRQIEGAANTVGNVYNQQAPKISGYADQIGSLVPGLVQQAQAGDAGINAARDYNVDVLSGQYLNEGNPYLEGVLSNSNNDIRNQLQAALGAKGLTGGSDYAGLISDKIAKNTLATRYQNYDAERARMATAAGQSPGIAAGAIAPVASAVGAAQAAGSLPMDAALKYGAGIGGLLGQYTNTTQKQSGGLGSMLGGLLGAGLSGWATGGFKV